MNPLVPVFALLGTGVLLALAMSSASGAGLAGIQTFALPPPDKTLYPYLTLRTGSGLGPVIVTLHGRGGTPEKLRDLLREHAKFPAIWVLPRGPVVLGSGRAWFSAEYKDGETRRTSELLKAAHSFDKFLSAFPGRVMLAGHSQGGAVALSTGLLFPDRVSGVVAASSYTGNFFQSGIRTKIALVHGTNDPVVPITDNQARFAGRDVKFVKVPGATHNDARLFVAWLNTIYGLGQILMHTAATPPLSPPGTGIGMPLDLVLREAGVTSYSASDFLTLPQWKHIAELPAALAPNVVRLAQVVQLLRNRLGHDIVVTSGYRPEEYNKLVDGAKNSAHLRAAAADLTLPPALQTPANARRLQVEAAKLWLAAPTVLAGLGSYTGPRGRVHLDVFHPGGQGRRTWGTGDVKGVLEEARRAVPAAVAGVAIPAPAYGVPAIGEC